jgi:hypothetical protein
MGSDIQPAPAGQSCQWCRAPLAHEAERCPACGAAVPRPDAELIADGFDPAFLALVDPPEPPAIATTAVNEGVVDGDPLLASLVTVAIAAAAGGLVGWLLLPMPLARAFQALLALPTQPSDVTRLGLFLGLLGGLFVGTLYRLVVRK